MNFQNSKPNLNLVMTRTEIETYVYPSASREQIRLIHTCDSVPPENCRSVPFLEQSKKTHTYT